MDDEIDAAWMEDLYSGNEEGDIDTFDQTSSPSSYASAVDSEDDMVGAIDATSVEDCHSGNEEEEINTDQEDYDYSDDNSDEKVDDDVDDDCYGEASDSDTIAGDVKSYTILTEEDLRQRQEEDITKTSTVLQISKEAACLILLGYNWRASNAHEEWFADEERVRNAVGIIADTPKVKFPGKKKFKCGICFENYTCKSLQCAGCGHLFCNSCWESYIRTSINDGPGCLMLRCPEPSCAAAVGLDMIDKLATDQDKAKYHSFLRRSYVENSRKIKWCPAPGCESAVEFDIGSGSYDVVCTCSYGFCWNCTEEAHRPVDCETVGKWILKNSSEAENTNWIIANSKPCPRCKRPIEKNHGCMHMTCTLPCKFEFCWLCLGAWSKHGERTGGFYSCNKYGEAKLAGAYDESERKREMAKQSLERYTHYYERWASNDLSREKALQSLNEMENVHLEKLGELQRKPVTELKFILEAWEQIVECRRVLKWTYAYGYYLPEQQLNSNLLLFECLQGEAESVLEMLHKCAELELMKYIKHDDTDKPSVDFKDFREKLVNVTRVTRIHFDNLVRALESGLSDSDSRPS